MKNQLFTRIKPVHDKQLRSELARAHSMIFLLSAILIVLLMAANGNELSFSMGLLIVVNILLAIVALTSLIVACGMWFRKSK